MWNQEPLDRVRLVREKLRIIQDFVVDAVRFIRYSAPIDGAYRTTHQSRHIEAQVTKDYHRIEKGLALREPKRPFGMDVEKRLSTLLLRAEIPKLSSSAAYLQYGRDALESLAQWNDHSNVVGPAVVDGGLLPKASIDSNTLAGFFHSRRSVRDFDTSRSVPREVLLTAVELALCTPSVCNRQAWTVHFYSGELTEGILSYQNGNKGFRSQVPCVAVIVVDSRLFSGAGERNQPWIEGGLFSMSLALALHGLGVASCMLNWSMRNRSTASLRKELVLKDWELVIMMMAVGYPAEGYRVARSERRSLDEVVVFRP